VNAGRFSLAWVQQESTQKKNTGRQNPAVTDRYYSTAGERSRARKGADGGIPAEKPGLHNPHRRAVDCAPYRLSVPLRLGGEEFNERFCSAVRQHRLRLACTRPSDSKFVWHLVQCETAAPENHPRSQLHSHAADPARCGFVVRNQHMANYSASPEAETAFRQRKKALPVPTPLRFRVQRVNGYKTCGSGHP